MAAEELDELYGPCRAGERHKWEVDVAQLECHELDHASGELLNSMLSQANSNPLSHKLNTNCTLLWALDALGVVKFCIEQSYNADDPANRFPRTRNVQYEPKVHHLGHPLLVDETGARIAGELYLDVGSDGLVWVLSNKSGRYGYGRTELQLANAAALFAEAGVFVKLDYRR